MSKKTGTWPATIYCWKGLLDFLADNFLGAVSAAYFTMHIVE